MILGLITACGGKDAQQEAADKAAASATPEARNPHVTGFELGHALDQKGQLYGGNATTFSSRDTLFGSIRTQYAATGAQIAARVRAGDKTLDSVNVVVGKPDSMGVALVPVHFAQGKGWAKGKVQLEVFLDGKFQAMKEFTIAGP